MIVTDKNLAAQAGVTHGFFGRHDDAASAARALGVSALHRLHQVHSAQCVDVVGAWPAQAELVKADAMVTDQPGQALGIITADCAPVLLAGQNAAGRPVIGAAHAGWRGALHGVLENTVAMMRDLGAVEIVAAVGPCIGPLSYEVSADFLSPFLAQDTANAAFFSASHFDLPAYVLHRLKLAGVEKAAWCGIDTYKNETDYFSYRRATHRSESDNGRQLSVIAIES